MYLLSTFVAFALVAQVFSMKYSDCGSKNGKIVGGFLSGCEDQDICELKRGETYQYGLDFESLTDSKSLKAVVHGVIAGISMPYPIPNADACEHGNIDCPLENGKAYNYRNEIEVKKSYPRVQADVKWELKDENNENVACILIPVKIV